MAKKSCSYTFRGPDGKNVVLRGMAAIKAFLATGGLEYLRGRDVRKSTERDATESPEFKRWLDGAEMVDGDHQFKTGDPVAMSLFHGTNRDVPGAFDMTRSGEVYGFKSGGAHFTNNSGQASRYARPSKFKQSGDFNVMPVFVRLKNPLVLRLDNDPIVGFDARATEISEQARAEGRDGIILLGKRGGFSENPEEPSRVEAGATEAGKLEVHVIAFEATQIKSAIGNRGTFDPADPDITRSAERSWYSQLERAIEGVPARLDNQSASQWAQWLKANAGKLGVKQDEVTWSGIEDFLKLKGKEKLSKAEIGEYLAGNGVRVTETTLGNRGTWTAEDSARLDELEENYDRTEEEDRERRDLIGRENDATKEGEGSPQSMPKYGQYVLPGGENYREVLLTLPEKNQGEVPAGWKLIDSAEEDRKDGYNVPADEVGPWKYKGPGVTSRNYKSRDEALAAMKREIGDQPTGRYRSSHWEGTPNVIAHIRLNDRTDADGRRVLFVEELQSDWGADARKKGIAPADWEAPYKEWERGLRERAKSFYINAAEGEEERAAAVRMGEKLAARDDLGSIATVISERPQMAEAWAKSVALRDGVPSAPFIDDTSKWLSLAMKRVISLATSEGYDAVAFVNGEQSAARYDLSKQVDRIDAKSSKAWNDEMVYSIDVSTSSGQDINRTALSAQGLEDTVGKEMAQRIIDGTAKTPGKSVRFSGLDLKIGGEGMKSFYDQIVPQAASALLKKMGGDGMTAVSIDTAQDLSDTPDDLLVKINPTSDGRFRVGVGSGEARRAETFGTREQAQAWADEQVAAARSGRMSKHPGFAITDAMREKAAVGMPLFSRERGWAGFPDAVIAAALAAQSKDPSYEAAKAGNMAAARKLVQSVLLDDAVAKVRAMIGDTRPAIVPVSAEEAAGRNKIPLAAADELGSQLDLEVDVDIVQSTRSRRSGRDGMGRLANQPEFIGEVAAGQDYLIVDDTLTQGGTLAQLKTYIEANGGRVVGAFALGGKQYSAKMALAPETLSKVRDAYGAIEDWWRDTLGFGFAGLTESEARYILNTKLSPDALRDRVAAARDEGRPGQAQGQAGREGLTTRGSAERATDTPEFKRWFGDSKVVDAEGEPLVVYHGTAEDFAEFDPSRAGRNYFGSGAGRGIFFTSNPGTASVYAEQPSRAYLNPAEPERADFGRGTASIMPVYLSLQNPLVIKTKKSPDKFFDGKWEDIFSRADTGGHDGVIIRGGAEFKRDLYVAMRPEQIKSAIGNDGSFDESDPNILSSAERAWQTPGASKFDDVVYKLQDKQVDLKRIVEAVKDARGEIRNDLDTYLQEELFHGRAAKRTEDFVNKELQPLVDEMAKRGLTIEDLDQYLHARHAPEANRLIAERNPDSASLQDGGSGLDTFLAEQYMADLPADKRDHLVAAAAKVDAMLAKTRKLVVDYELEGKDTVTGWGSMFEHYVPLMREDDGDAPARLGTGQGFSIKGREVKSRTGSTRKVVDILANIAMQRERTIVRGEKNRVAQSLIGLAQANPNKDFWTVDLTPSTPTYDPKKGVVVMRPDPMFKSRPNVVVAKVREEDGSVKEHAVSFSEKDARAMRTAAALKNLDAAQLEGLMGASASITRYFAAVNTQYNPVFGVVNLVRDVQGALINLQATELAGKQKDIAKNTLSALRGIYADARAVRRGKSAVSAWAGLWEDFQDVGGQTGFRQLFATSNDRAEAIQKALNPDAWMDSKLGKIFTANGTLRVPLAVAMKGARWIFDWLSDYNLAMENGIRLAAFKAGLDAGMSRERAASLAKNLTVNFNRKGQIGQQAGAVYAFFNASMQGTARLGQVIFDMDPGKPKTIRLSGLGKKVVYGGLTLGAMQALALAAAGFSDDDPPDFVRERALVIPTGGKSYIAIPMPLGFHLIPSIGRMTTEWAMGGFKDTPQRAVKMLGMFADTFNPIGNAGLSMQTLAPTALDPLVALTENRDWQGRPIAKESMNKAVPGHTLARDTATAWSRLLSEAVNAATGGNEYVAGAISPTPDQIDYLIGQITGGVGREVSKVEQATKSVVTGEELPLYKIPLVGRFAGSSASQASEGNAFYANTERLNRLETEIKGLQKDGKMAEASALRAGRPDAYLMAQANLAERQIAKLRKQKSELVKDGAPREQVRSIEEQITARMAALNRAAEALKERAPI